MREKPIISMIARETADEAFARFLLTKRGGGVKTKALEIVSAYHSSHNHTVSEVVFNILFLLLKKSKTFSLFF